MTDHKVVDIATGKPTERNYPVEEMDFRHTVIAELIDHDKCLIIHNKTITSLINSIELLNERIVRLEKSIWWRKLL